jgi:outer membrane protein OmpA-like peptidoglycan-associated protein
LFPKESWLQPFLAGGTGIAVLQKKVDLYLPGGVGLQFQYKEIYLLFNAQYRYSILQNFKSHSYYSIGLAGVISKKRLLKPGPSKKLKKRSDKDRDHDGVSDSLDVCPDQAGVAALAGCMDTDNDGVEDSKDRCPKVFGLAELNGCAAVDSDKDGISDDLDSCKFVPGTIRYQGCPIPDLDKDGINDEEDKCISTFGVREHQGCPLIRQELTDQIQKAAKNIFFKTGSYELLNESFIALDKVVDILNENQGLLLSIEGHTDDEGGVLKNKVLSEKRAGAVADYLGAKAIGVERLRPMGFGQTRPLTDNDTKEGRAMNRRVELKLRY